MKQRQGKSLRCFGEAGTAERSENTRQRDESLFVGEYRGNSRVSRAGDGRGVRGSIDGETVPGFSREDESSSRVFSFVDELEAVGDNGDQAALRWGLGLAHLQQALLFTSRHLRQLISQKNR